jgi:hypothetical protein
MEYHLHIKEITGPVEAETARYQHENIWLVTYGAQQYIFRHHDGAWEEATTGNIPAEHARLISQSLQNLTAA